MRRTAHYVPSLFSATPIKTVATSATLASSRFEGMMSVKCLAASSTIQCEKHSRTFPFIRYADQHSSNVGYWKDVSASDFIRIGVTPAIVLDRSGKSGNGRQDCKENLKLHDHEYFKRIGLKPPLGRIRTDSLLTADQLEFICHHTRRFFLSTS